MLGKPIAGFSDLREAHCDFLARYLCGVFHDFPILKYSKKSLLKYEEARYEIPMDESLYREVIKLVLASGLTKTAAAKKLGITPQHFGQVCAGRTKPSAELHARIIALRDKLKSSGLLEIA